MPKLLVSDLENLHVLIAVIQMGLKKNFDRPNLVQHQSENSSTF